MFCLKKTSPAVIKMFSFGQFGCSLRKIKVKVLHPIYSCILIFMVYDLIGFC